MPLWDFECEQCKRRLELQFSSYDAMKSFEVLTTEGISPCPDCGGPLYRVPSAPSFQIHGFNSKNNYSRG